MTAVYVVLKVFAEPDGRIEDENGKALCPRAEMQGVFSSEEAAAQYCLGHENYMLGPVELDNPVVDDTTPWPGVRWPEAERQWAEYNAQPSPKA